MGIKMNFKSQLCAAILTLGCSCLTANAIVTKDVAKENKAQAQHYQPSPENLESRKQFQDDKFGIFLHWGLYSMLATGEWTMTNKDLNYKEYAKLAGGFYPSKFDAAKWVAAIKASGAKYICFTTRHHEGFSMFKTKYSDYNIVDATPFRRDIVKELADECHKQGIALHLYYSHIDWYREDAVWGRTGRGTGRPNPKGNWIHLTLTCCNSLTINTLFSVRCYQFHLHATYTPHILPHDTSTGGRHHGIGKQKSLLLRLIFLRPYAVLSTAYVHVDCEAAG